MILKKPRSFIPTRSQYKSWSLPSKYSLIGLVIAIISLAPLVLEIRNWIMAVPSYASIAYNYDSSEMMIYGAAGESADEAVIIRGANTNEAGVSAEYYWIKRRYPGYKVQSQAIFERVRPSVARNKILVDEASGVGIEVDFGPPVSPGIYDVLRIKNWYGRTREVYFDVSPFLGKGYEVRALEEHARHAEGDFVDAARKTEETKSPDID